MGVKMCTIYIHVVPHLTNMLVTQLQSLPSKYKQYHVGWQVNNYCLGCSARGLLIRSIFILSRT